MERGQKFSTSVITKGKLEVRQKSSGKGRKSSMRGGGLVNIPLRSFSSKGTLEQPNIDKVIGDGIRRKPHVERSNMICRICSSKAFKLGDVGMELGQHSRPTSVMAYRVIYQLVKIRKTKAYHIGEKGRSRDSSCCGPTSSIPNIRSGATTSVRS